MRSSYDTGLGEDDLKIDDVPFSLNKKGRWSLPYLIKQEIICGDHTNDDFGIQLEERHKIAKYANCITISCTREQVTGGNLVKSKRNGYLQISNGLKRRSLYSRRERRDRLRRGLPIEDENNDDDVDDEQDLEYSQLRYDVLYPSPANSAITRNPKFIKCDTNTPYVWNGCHDRRRGNRHRKKVSDDMINEAFSIMDEDFENLEEDIVSSDSEEQQPTRRLENPTFEVIIVHAMTIGELVNVSVNLKSKKDKVRNTNDQNDVKRHIVHVNRDVHEIQKTLIATNTDTAISLDARLDEMSTVMEPVNVILPFEQITPQNLRLRFGNSFVECEYFPRRFIVDISDQVSMAGKFKGYKKNTRTVNACLVFVLDEDNKMNTVTDAACKVFLNTNFGSKCENVKLETIFDYMETNLDEVIDRTLFFIETLPDDAINLNSTKTWFYHAREKRTNLEEFARWSTHSYYADDEYLLKYFISRELDIKDVTEMGYKVVSHFDSFNTDDKKDVTSPKNIFCGVCYELIGDEKPATALISCGHWFCNKCWREHLETQINTGAILLPCPEHECNKNVDSGTALSFISMPTIIKHARCCHDTEVERHSDARWCPNERCGRVLKTNSTKVKTARCKCGVKCCLDCLGQPHWPADCDSTRNFQKRMVANGDSTIIPADACTQLVVNGKICPHCHRFVEKHGGSIFMVCVCRGTFCWGCGKDYSPINKHMLCYARPVKQGTKQIKLRQADKLSKLKRRKWYKMALVHRVRQHPFKLKLMKSASWRLGKKIREYLNRSELKGIPLTLDFNVDGKVYTREADKVADFLSNMVNLYSELSLLVENMAVLIDSKRKDINVNMCFPYMANRLAVFVDVIYNLFVNAEERSVKENLDKMKEVRKHARNAIQVLVTRATDWKD